MRNYKNSVIVVSELIKFEVRKAKLITQFCKYLQKYAAAKKYFSNRATCDYRTKKVPPADTRPPKAFLGQSVKYFSPK